MSFRIENKYLLNDNNLNKFFKFLSMNKAKSIYNKRKIYSIYFDNINMDSFRDSEEGTVPRKKIRIRFYNEANIDNLSEVLLEKKISSYDGKFKTSKLIKNFKKLIRYGIMDDKYGHCKITAEVNYVREYYLVNNLRITLDRFIQYKKPMISNSLFHKEKLSVFEIKTNNTNQHNLIEELFPFPKSRFSKYANAIELIY